jgi:hypothetical protein
MPSKISTFYKYRSFSLNALHSLCEDTLFFSAPSAFNDPFDSRPTLEGDSSLTDLRQLLEWMIRRRVELEVRTSVKRVRMGRARADFYTTKNAEIEARKALDYVAYHATNPDYTEGPVEAERQLLRGEIERELLQHYESGVCCFSESYKSALLWSHYGDQHRGLCIGYTADRKPAPELKRVVYGGSRCVKTSLVASAFLRNDGVAKRKLDKAILLRKAKDWNYECEWRLIGTSGEQDSPLLMKEVIFGLRCPLVVRHAVVSALERRRSPVSFFEMRDSPTRYTLKREPLDRDELGAYLPRVAESGQEMFPPIEPGELD